MHRDGEHRLRENGLKLGVGERPHLGAHSLFHLGLQHHLLHLLVSQMSLLLSVKNAKHFGVAFMVVSLQTPDRVARLWR